MNAKLPEQLKSGRKLVATAAAGQVGLYWGGRMDADDWRILLPNGKFKRGKLCTRGWPYAPDGRWTWLPGLKPGKKFRAGGKHDPSGAAMKKPKRSLERSAQVTQAAATVVPPSLTHVCCDCERNDLQRLKHYHTTVDERGYRASICCRCARRRGHRCAIREDFLRSHPGKRGRRREKKKRRRT